MAIGTISNWVRSNVSGAQTKDSKSLNPQADQIDRDYGQIQDELQKVDAELDQIDASTQLKPPSLSSISNGQLLAIGASAGAAIGATVGMLDNVLTSAAAEPQVNIIETKHDINKPVLMSPAFTETRTETHKQVPIFNPDGSQAGTRPQLTGWHVAHNPSIRNDKIGEYTTREAQIESNGASNPLVSGLMGAAVGAGIGAGVAGITIAVRKYLPNGAYQAGEERETKDTWKVMAKMAAAGAVGGAALGGLSGILAGQHSRTIEIVNERPVFKTETLGQIPRDYDLSVYSGANTSPGMRDVQGQVPETRFGITGRQPVIETDKRTISVGGNSSLAMSVLGGAVVGAGAGLAAGVLTNVLRKTL